MNSKSISNITNNNEIDIGDDSVNETAKLINKVEKIDAKSLDKDINEIKEIKKEECKSEIKTTGIFSGVKRTKNNTFRIKTFHEPRKKEN